MKKISLLILVAFLFFTFPVGSTAYALSPQHIYYIDSTHIKVSNTFIGCNVNGLDTLSDGGTDTPQLTAISNSASYCYESVTDIGDYTHASSTYIYYKDWNHGSPNTWQLTWSLGDPEPTPTPTPTPTPDSSILGSTTLEPTQQAQINEAVSSIPNTAGSEILPILMQVLPFIMVVVALYIAFKFVRKQMQIAHNWEHPEGHSYNADTDTWDEKSSNSWVDSSEGIHEHLENRHIE